MKVMMKARSEGATTMFRKQLEDTLNQAQPQAEHPVTKDDPIDMARQLAYFKHVRACATSRKARAEDLMQRKAAKSWDAAKKAKMVRRLVTANQEVQQAEGAIDHLTNRLEQVATAS